MSDKFGCCDTCANYDSSACGDCEDADHYEFDEELIEEMEARLPEAA